MMRDPLDDLRAAAKLLRDRAEAAAPGPWHRAADHERPRGQYPDNAIGYWDGEYARCVSYSGTGQGAEADADAVWIVTMHPGVGLALADWLESVAARWVGRAELNYPARHVFQQHALRVARLILGEAADG